MAADPLLPIWGYNVECLLWHNRQRASRRLPPLGHDWRLAAGAIRWAAEMADEDRMYHSPGWVARMASDGIVNVAAGENIAYGLVGMTDEAVWTLWMGDAPHRDNLLNPSWTHAGFGRAVSRSGKTYWCADFMALTQPTTPVPSRPG